MNATTTTSGSVTVTSETSTATSTRSTAVAVPAHTRTTVVGVKSRAETAEHSAKKFESAVFSHIQAVRALGRTNINTTEIANALKLSQSIVDRTIDALKKKGVKVAG